MEDKPKMLFASELPYPPITVSAKNPVYARAMLDNMGGDPRLWTQHGVKKAYWTPGCNRYPPRLPALLQNSIAGEKAAVSKYQHQCSHIKDPCIVEILRRVILDEEMHVQIYEQMFEMYCSRT